MFWHLILVVVFLAEVLLGNDVRMPPDITRGPQQHFIYRDDETIRLECVSNGNPVPRFEWIKDGSTVNANDPSIRWMEPLITGTIEILNADKARMGYYQCIATNQYGIALSNVTFLQMALLERFSSVSPVMQYGAEGDNLVLPCQPLRSIPSATYSWALALSIDDTNPANFIENERVQIDDFGYLHFAYLLKEDEQNHKLYKCQIFNSVLDITQGGSYANISVTVNQPIPTSAPTPSFSTASTVIGLVGESVKMSCLFDGNPIPKLSWKKSNGALPPLPRWSLDKKSYDTEATINDLEKSDAGDYVCTGSSNAGVAASTITLRIEAKPRFILGANHLSSMNITDGESVTFTCASNATPSAVVTWYRDGKPIEKNSLPPKYRLSADGLNLTITDLCKTCPDGSDSLAVIQCNASNVHSYAFAQGSVNVILKTKITDGPLEILWEPSVEVVLPCHATSDDLTPFSHSWLYNDLALIYDGNIRFDQDEQTLYIRTTNDTDFGAGRVGTYKCVVTNGYSTASVEHRLTNTITVVTAASELWWIPLLIAIIILIIILVLLIWIFIQRNRGDSYSVDKKERWTGNDPEQELIVGGFQNYQRGDENKLIQDTSKSSKGSFADLTTEDSTLQKRSQDNLQLNDPDD